MAARANLWHVCTQCPVQEEGIIVKAANSPWRCNDRGNAWLKIKPDYLQVRRSNMLCCLSCLIGP